MSDKIKLLPDAIANQIAAGEVIQRPASVVKELLENSVDSGAKSIQLIIKDAGRALIQVVDDGCGMSETDARMCFERHATSKIKQIEDLFSLYTFGFRGEAMASIAAIAQVELKSKLHDKDIGTILLIEGSKVVLQEPVATNSGTSISVKNLFYNVPARRNFLKSNQIETKHIIDEFIHVAMANPSIFFSLHHNGLEVYHLKASNLRQRIVSIFGKNYNEKLVPIEEITDYVSVRGFIGKPDVSKKTRGEQFFFVNNRFIKNNFLNYAISKAYEGLMAEKNFPFYCLFIDIEPNAIDINIHPTKQEIKFEDEKAVYLLLNAAAKHGLSQYSVMPTIDFEHESTFNLLVDERVYNEQPFTVVQSKLNSDSHTRGSYYSPFDKDIPATSQRAISPTTTNNFEYWKKLYELDESTEEKAITIKSKMDLLALEEENELSNNPFKNERFEPIQLHERYILTQIKSGFILIDQHKAHQRVLFEKYLRKLNNQPATTQRILFPKSLELSSSDAEIIKELLPDFKLLGFDIEFFGGTTFVVHGMPSDLKDENETLLIEKLLEDYKNSAITEQFDKRKNVAKSLAYQTAIKSGKSMDRNSMQQLIDELFACEQPTISPIGLATFTQYSFDEIERKFGN
ncbi:MAG TPA: DNA mismatch repair endonuclease MutL [Chitinophagales bacterium]|jgi:DNA mismatch repair protein MutL|nr:DNA mismatch repair endonuclease MutL [Chitinophagales bacterium]HQW78043.1 DNA mismatch repair endonuclease MutL [Chitinophagales bacterium]HRB66819.1 DNA mismatch repair endonuclease MutL [Chitinophagales bacterium]